MKKLLNITVAALLLGGCVSEYTGSRTIVGEEIAWPEISDASDTISVRVFQSIKGAKVWTAKDSRVTAKYRNSYTNSYFFGTIVLRDSMHLDLVIEPLDTSSATTGASDTDILSTGDCKGKTP